MIKFYLISLLVFLSVSAQAKYCDKLPGSPLFIKNGELQIAGINNSLYQQINTGNRITFQPKGLVGNVVHGLYDFFAPLTFSAIKDPSTQQVIKVIRKVGDGADGSSIGYNIIHLKYSGTKCYVDKIEFKKDSEDNSPHDVMYTSMCNELSKATSSADQKAILTKYHQRDNAVRIGTTDGASEVNAKNYLTECNKIPSVAQALKDTSLWTASPSSSLIPTTGTK